MNLRTSLKFPGAALWLSLLVCALTLCARAEETQCFVCGAAIRGKAWKWEDLVTGETRIVCTNCAALPDRCATCNLPVNDSRQTLPDGRILCARDSAAAVQTEEEGKQICADAVADLNRLFSRWLEFPGTNSLVSVVNRFYLENLIRNPGVTKATVDILGATTSNPMPGGRFIHNIVILSYLSKAELRSVCAHEFTHAWMGQNLILEHRKTPLAKDMNEAMCELVAHKYMESLGETREMGRIERNDYTHGKIRVLLAADQQYGFNTVLEWLAHGDDADLSLDNLDRIRSVEGHPVTSQAELAGLLYVPRTAVASSAPTNLVLKSVSGSAKRRFALINSTTFELMEQAKVRVGQTNLTVRCLEIRDDSVTVEVEGQSGKKELFLGASN